jgi:formamidopyrimidine-DNA glycosylase
MEINKLKEKIERYENTLKDIQDLLKSSPYPTTPSNVYKQKKKCFVCHKEKEDVKLYSSSFICKDCEDSVNRAYDELYD